MNPAVSAYSDRVKTMSHKQIAANLKAHEALIASDRWELLPEETRADLEAMGQLLRDAGTGIAL